VFRAEDNQELVAINRFATFTALVQEFHLTQKLTRASRYEQFIVQKTLERLALSAEDVIFDYLPELLLHLYYTEMAYHPWGRLTWHHSRVITPRGVKPFKDLTGAVVNVRILTCPVRVPNFLMPVDCLLCGRSLSFKSYGCSSLKKIMHEPCTKRWARTVGPKHREAIKILNNWRRINAKEAQPILWESYLALAPLYAMSYKPRWRLIPQYQDLPKTWPDTLEIEENIQDLRLMPFLKQSPNDLIEAEMLYAKRFANQTTGIPLLVSNPKKAFESFNLDLEESFESEKDAVEGTGGLSVADFLQIPGEHKRVTLTELNDYFIVPTSKRSRSIP
jgi:hypothetical protein